MGLIYLITWIITAIILISPFILLFFIIKAVIRGSKRRKAKKQSNSEWKSEWVWNEETKLWEHPLSAKGDTTYRYTKENIPKEDTPEEPQQTHFHHEDTSFKVGKTEYTAPKNTASEPKATYHYTKDEIPRDEARCAGKPKDAPPQSNTTTKKESDYAAQRPKTGPKIIYTYSKPELKIEDIEKPNSEELDFSSAYQRKPLFTKNEWQNYKRLREIAEVRGFVICPKVRLFDLVEPRHDKKRKLTYRYKIQAKHVDFVICDKDMNIKAILELDDSSHYDPDRIKRDNFVNTILLNTGYTVIHTKNIENRIFDLI